MPVRDLHLFQHKCKPVLSNIERERERERGAGGGGGGGGGNEIIIQLPYLP